MSSSVGSSSWLAQVPEASFEVALNATEHVAWQSRVYGFDRRCRTAAADS